MVDFLIRKEVDGLFPLGTTGEMFRLSFDERKNAAEYFIKEVSGRVPVFIHVGAMTIDDAAKLAEHAYYSGADGVAAVTPVFFKATDEEIEEYYTRIANSVPKDFPFYLYNIPQYSGNDINKETAQKIAEKCHNVIGIKYSYPDLFRTEQYLDINNGSFSVLQGTDRLFTALLAMNCDGIVSGNACVFPEIYVKIKNAYYQDQADRARTLQKEAVKLSEVLLNDSNIAVLKGAIKLRGLNVGHSRGPCPELDDSQMKKLKTDLEFFEGGKL